MIRYDVGMHRAGVLLFRLLLVLVDDSVGSGSLRESDAGRAECY